MAYPNYIKDRNRFSLAGPPLWWLSKLWDFDDSLVVIPSRIGFYYRLCQRRPPDHRTQIVTDILKDDGDSAMIASYGLVPVTTIIATASWDNPLMFEELRNRAPWRMGGAEKVLSDIEAYEAEKEAKIAANIDDINTQVAKDGWGLYNKKIGTRSHMWIPKTG